MESARLRPGIIPILALPPLFLALYFFAVRMPLPAFLLPGTTYLCIDSKNALDLASSPELIKSMHLRGEILLSGESGLLPLAQGVTAAEAFELAAASLPDHARTAEALEDVSRRAMRREARHIRIIVSGPLLAEEYGSLAEAARRMPVSVEASPGTATGTSPHAAAGTGNYGAGADNIHAAGSAKPQAPALALARRTDSDTRVSSSYLLLPPYARTADEVRIVAEDGPDAGKTLYSGRGADLPADMRLEIPVPGAAERRVRVRIAGKDGVSEAAYSAGTGPGERGKILLLGTRTDRSALDGLYAVTRMNPAAAAEADLAAWDLIVIDGLPLRDIQGPLLRKLVERTATRSGSLLFVGDSPEFGKKGDNPDLEAILPVLLEPRSLKDAPEMAVLILLDQSGSMFGDKLALAKLTGIEMLNNLKPDDRVGMLLFSDERRWIHAFEPNRTIEPLPDLEPLHAGGGTDLGSALAEGLGSLSGRGEKERHVIVISDGVSKPFDAASIAAKAAAADISISTVAVGPDADRKLLGLIASRSGGKAYAVDSPEAVPSIVYEDRRSIARPSFATGSIPILALNGEEVARVAGMTQYTASREAIVLFSNDLGDPFFASKESGGRAVLFFASDLYGAWSSGFFASPPALRGFVDRIDPLVSRTQAEMEIIEFRGAAEAVLRSDSLAAPRISLTKAGSKELSADFVEASPGIWKTVLRPSEAGKWRLSLSDSGRGLDSFDIVLNEGFSGLRDIDVDAASAFRSVSFGRARVQWLWLLMFFASSLWCTVLLRRRP